MTCMKLGMYLEFYSCVSLLTHLPEVPVVNPKERGFWLTQISISVVLLNTESKISSNSSSEDTFITARVANNSVKMIH